MLHIDIFDENDFRRLDAVRAPHCVSIYLPTHLKPQVKDEDRILFRDLLRDMRRTLSASGADARAIEEIEEQLRALDADEAYWAYLAEGLAVFATPDRLETYRTPITFAREIEVSDRFHLKPMLPLLTQNQAAFVLELAQNRVRLWKLTAGDIREVHVPHMPKDIFDAMFERGMDNKEVLRMENAPDKKVRQRQFARMVERAVRPVLRSANLPLVLAGVETLVSYYRETNTHPDTLETTIGGNQEETNPDDLAARARALVAERGQGRAADIISRIAARRSEGLSSTDLAEIARAADEGRIDTLLVNLDETVYGSFRGGVGRIVPGEQAAPSTYDILDDLAGHALRQGGRVFGAHANRLPEGFKAGAIFRWRA